MNYREWLGDQAHIRIIAPPSAVESPVPPDNVTVVPDYDRSGLVDQAAFAEYHRRPFDHLLSLSEYDLLRAARLREVLGLPGQDTASARAFRDKVVMKDHWSRHGVPITGYAPVETATDLLAFVRDRGLPVVVKPRTGTGSRAVSVLRTGAEVTGWLGAHWSLGLAEVSNWMVEAFVDGEMLTVDGILNGEEFDICWPSSTSSCLAFTSAGATVSGTLDPGDPAVAACRALVYAALRALPHPDLTLFHAEVWRRPDGTFWMNEIASRQGGARIGPMIRHAFGVPLAGRYAAGSVYPARMRSDVPPPVPLHPAGYALVPPSAGTVVALPDPADTPAWPWLLNIEVNAQLGTRCEPAQSAADAVASAVVTGDDHAGVLRHCAEFIDWIGCALRLEA